jgi:hypothetical protein
MSKLFICDGVWGGGGGVKGYRGCLGQNGELLELFGTKFQSYWVQSMRTVWWRGCLGRNISALWRKISGLFSSGISGLFGGKNINAFWCKI